MQPFWPTPEVTPSEAAATKDLGELYRLVVFEGKDPARPWPVRAGLLGDHPIEVTPLEAGVRIGRAEVVRLLLDQGVGIDAARRIRFICFAARAGYSEVIDVLLATGDRSDPRPTCESIK